jgi:hypothetical protein
MPYAVADLLIYAVPILEGILGGRHLNRSANFYLMIAVCAFDVAILPVVVFGAKFLPSLLPYAVAAIILAIMGLVGSKYVGKAVNAFLAIVVFCVGMAVLAISGIGRIEIVFGPRYVSANSLIAPVVFILVTRLAYRLRRFAAPLGR